MVGIGQVSQADMWAMFDNVGNCEYNRQYSVPHHYRKCLLSSPETHYSTNLFSHWNIAYTSGHKILASTIEWMGEEDIRLEVKHTSCSG